MHDDSYPQSEIEDSVGTPLSDAAEAEGSGEYILSFENATRDRGTVRL
jgi:hypothetical protein